MFLRVPIARVAALLCVVAFGCASGGVPRLGDDADVPDTNTGKHDAPPFDATPPTDGAVDSMQIDSMVPPDSGGGNPPFCLQNPDCIEPNTCCFFGQCKPGLAEGDLCFPS